MRASKRALLIALAVASMTALAGEGRPEPVTSTMTIGELSAQARLRRIAEETAKPATTAAAPGAPAAGAPAGMTIVPSTKILAGADSSPPPAAGTTSKAKVEKKAPPPDFIPAVLAIYHRGGSPVVELADENGSAKFQPGQVTPSGWTIAVIDAHEVELVKPDTRTRTTRRLTLPVNNH